MTLPWYFPFLLILGLVCGALVNYLSDVLPYRRRIVHPFCLSCGQPMEHTNYFLWPRKCEHCGWRRSVRTWLVEAVFAGVILWLGIAPPSALGFLPGLLLLVYFGVIVVIDMEHRLILHPVSIVGAVLGLVLGTYLHGLWATILGGLAGFGIMFAFYYFGALFARLMGRLRGQTVDEEALGFGDVNLTGVLGLVMGWPAVIVCILLGFLVGALMSLVYLAFMLLARRFRWFAPIPYGPSLVSSAIILLFFRDGFSRMLGF